MLSWMEPELGASVVDIVVSLDAYVKQHRGQEVATASYSDVRPSLKTLTAIVDRIDALAPEVEKLQGHPRAYLWAMLGAFKYFARDLGGEEIPYTELIAGIQEIDFAPIATSKSEILANRVSEQLGALGYGGALPAQIDAWLDATRIPADQVVKVADKFLARSKVGTLARVIGLPEEDGIDSVNEIRGVFWSGYSKYQGGYRGKLTFNIDRPWYESVFAQILTHEGYPGHQAFYCRWDYLFQNGKLPIEAAYYLINSPTNALFEGGPETALHFLGWDAENEDTPDVSAAEKQQFVLARDYLDMQRIATTNACYYVNTGQMGRAEAIAYMAKTGYVKELEAGLAYRFFTDSIQRLYYPSYYYGRWMIGRAYDSVPVAARKTFFQILYDTPHTTRTFINAVSDLIERPFDPFNESQWPMQK